MYMLWNAIEAPTLWVAGAQSHIAGWLAADRDPALEVGRRFAHLRHGRLETIDDAGHMLHHDQPEALARLLEAFFAA
jgi:pimeloyl-ACP methyl ester carboxylesterase